MPFLTLVIIIIDRDVSEISKKIREIHKKIKLSHEIIIVDNREKTRDVLIDFCDAKVITKGFNCYQFESKRYAAEFCNGEYIWFIDSDDSIFEVDCDTTYISFYDLIVFDYLENYDPLREFNRNYRYHGEYKGLYNPYAANQLSAEAVRSYIQCFTWNKWFRAKIFKEIAKKLPQNKQIIIMEDEFWVNIFLKNIKEFLIYDKILYLHNINSGLTTQNNFSLKKLKTFLIGFEEMKEIIQENLSKNDCQIMLFNALKYALHKIKDIKNKNEIIEIFQIIREKYSYTQIKIALIEIVNDWGFPRNYIKAFDIYEFLLN